jgi:hypothetical protein
VVAARVDALRVERIVTTAAGFTRGSRVTSGTDPTRAGFAISRSAA